MNKKILITGANGAIGTVLRNGLRDFEVTTADLPDQDVRKYQSITPIALGHDAIIHLAWGTSIDPDLPDYINEDNTRMVFNVYQAAIECGVPRVIIASSVHADRFDNWAQKGYISPYSLPSPSGPYGAHKVFIESLGKYFSTKGLEVVCIRFGAVHAANVPNPDNPAERSVFFRHEDCVTLVRSALEVKKVPGNFAIVYGVSDNPTRVHDLSNPFGWIPAT